MSNGPNNSPFPEEQVIHEEPKSSEGAVGASVTRAAMQHMAMQVKALRTQDRLHRSEIEVLRLQEKLTRAQIVHLVTREIEHTNIITELKSMVQKSLGPPHNILGRLTRLEELVDDLGDDNDSLGPVDQHTIVEI